MGVSRIDVHSVEKNARKAKSVLDLIASLTVSNQNLFPSEVKRFTIPAVVAMKRLDLCQLKIYRARKNCLQNVISTAQAGSGRLVKLQQ